MKKMPRSAITFITALAGLAVTRAFAHEGHGLETRSHWHATDTVGLLAGAVAIALALWFARGGK